MQLPFAHSRTVTLDVAYFLDSPQLLVSFVSHLTLNIKLAPSAVCMNGGVCKVLVWIQPNSPRPYREMYCLHRVLVMEYFPSWCSISNTILFGICEVLRDTGYKDCCTAVRCVSTQSRLQHAGNTSTHHSLPQPPHTPHGNPLWRYSSMWIKAESHPSSAMNPTYSDT